MEADGRRGSRSERGFKMLDCLVYSHTQEGPRRSLRMPGSCEVQLRRWMGSRRSQAKEPPRRSKRARTNATRGETKRMYELFVFVSVTERERGRKRERKKHRERGQHLRLLEMTAHTAPNAPNEKENESMCACVFIEVSGVFPCTRMYTNYLTVSVCRVSVSVYVSILVEAQVVEATVMCGNGCEGDDAGGHSRKSSY